MKIETSLIFELILIVNQVNNKQLECLELHDS